MRILIYKRTHKGDPDNSGVFGIQDCMGRIRSWRYDAVIGIGGKRPWKENLSIKQKINWIGLKPKRIKSNGRADCVVFSHFALYEEKGPNIETQYPNLFKHMYGSRKRFDMSIKLPEPVYEEVMEVLKLAENEKQSREYEINEILLKSEHSEKENIEFDCSKGKQNCKTILNEERVC